jgi:hypothetical protein
MTAGEFNDLGHFCFRHLKSEDAADAHTVAMDMQHHLNRLLTGLAEDLFQDMDDKFHWCVVVVEQYDLVEIRLFGLRTRLSDNAGSHAVTVLSVIFATAILHGAILNQDGAVLPSSFVRIGTQIDKAGLKPKRLQSLTEPEPFMA